MNEIIDKVKETDDMILLIEQHQKEIWEWKQKEHQWIRDKNQLDGNKRIIVELSTKLIDMKKRAQEAEGENTIIKGIGNNSPEMKALRERVKQLDNSLAIALEVNDKHQRYNGELQTRVTELEEDNQKLAKQITDKIDQMRKSGM